MSRMEAIMALELAQLESRTTDAFQAEAEPEKYIQEEQKMRRVITSKYHVLLDLTIVTIMLRK
jgi:hypothetical protein